MELNKELLKFIGVDLIPEDRNYWFVRTQKGTYYNEFYNENYIGIEWDKVSDLEILNTAKEETIKSLVEKEYPEKDRSGYIGGQIYRFVQTMKKGDIVIIPSQGSVWLAFGELVDDNVYLLEEDKEKEFEEILEEFYDETQADIDEKTVLKKRRKVKWIKTVKRTELDPQLYKIIYSHNTIVDAKDYSFFIDRMLSNFFIKGEEAYYTFKVNKKNNINYKDMLSFLNNNENMIEALSRKYPELNINSDELILKISVQSKGPISFKGTVKNMLYIGLLYGALFGVKFDLNAFGMEINFETEGIPKWISMYSEVVNNNKEIKDSEEIKELYEKLKADFDNLEIDEPKQIAQ